MVYIEKKKMKNNTYFYLVKNVRFGKTFKKFRIYLGRGELSKKELQELVSKHKKHLDSRIDAYMKNKDPLSNLITSEQVKRLEEIKKKYRKNYSQLPKEVQKKVYEDILVRFTYNTNAIEGSKVTLGETKLILLDKISPSNRSLVEIKETENHKKAFDFMINYKGDVNRKLILQLHKILTEGILDEINSGETRGVQVVIVGANILPPPPEKVDKELNSLLKWYRTNKTKYHPVIVTSYFHSKFEEIHPFIDFNGRTGRLLLNFILMKSGYPIIDIKHINRLEYYDSLQKAQNNKFKPFINLVVEYIKQELNKVV